MKRRSFLSLLGAAITAPVMPAIGKAAPVAAAIKPSAYSMAVFHARTRANISAKGLAYCLKVSQAEAEAMIAKMASKGLVEPIIGSGDGAVRAVSNILEQNTWGLPKAATQINARDTHTSSRQAEPNHWSEPDLSLFIAHLRRICAAQGQMA